LALIDLNLLISNLFSLIFKDEEIKVFKILDKIKVLESKITLKISHFTLKIENS